MKNVSIITTEQWKEGYKIVKDYALRSAYYRQNTTRYEEVYDAGIKVLAEVACTYDAKRNPEFGSHLRGVLELRGHSEYNRYELHQLPIADGFEMETYCGMFEEMRQSSIVEDAKVIIRKKVKEIAKNNLTADKLERNARIVELRIGLDGGEGTNCNDLAEDFGISAEAVRKICKVVLNAIKADKECQNILFANVG